MAKRVVGAERQAELDKASAEVDGRLRAENKAKWQRVWDESGIKFSSVSMEAWAGEVRGEQAIPDSLPLGTVEPLAGDLVVLHEGDEEGPTDSNQHLHRVVRSELNKVGGYVAFLGPALPRSEWPEALRAATVPTAIRVESTIGATGAFFTVRDGDGKEICDMRSKIDGDSDRLGLLEQVVREAAKLGYEDGMEGRRRSFDVRKGAGTWQVADDRGTARDVEGRNFMQRRPPRFVEVVLITQRAAYVEGMGEALDVKARAAQPLHVEEEAPAPRM